VFPRGSGTNAAWCLDIGPTEPHTPVMGEPAKSGPAGNGLPWAEAPGVEVRGSGVGTRRPRPRSRVFIRDERNDGRYLRATWHPERQMFVVSTWHDEVCTGAVRMSARDAGDLVTLVVDGLTQSIAEPRRPARTGGALQRMERRLRDWRRRLTRPRR